MHRQQQVDEHFAQLVDRCVPTLPRNAILEAERVSDNVDLALVARLVSVFEHVKLIFSVQ